MTGSVNERLLDETVAHQVGLQRYSAGVVRKIVSLLNDVDSDLVGQIAKFDPTDNRNAQKRLEKLLAAIRELNVEAYRALGKELTGELKAFAEYEADYQADLFENVLPINFDVVKPNRHQLVAAVTAKPFQGALLKEWVAGLEEGRFKRLQGAIRMGFVEGQTVDQMVRQVRGTRAQAYRDGILDTSRRSAEALVRTSINHTAIAAREELYKENPDLIKGVRWVSTLDSRTSAVCRGRDGKVYPPGKGPRPPAHINCRSTTVPITKSFRELGIDLDEVPPSTRASMDGQVPEGMSYSGWLRGKSPAFQEDILGKTKAKLFRDGELELDRFVDDKGREYTLEELKGRERKAWAKAFGEKPADPKPKPERKPRQAKPAEPPPPAKRDFGATIPEELARHEKHFAGAPQPILDVIRTSPAVGRVEDTGAGAFYRHSDRFINMNAVYQGAGYGVVWRHEYGHFVDFNRSGGTWRAASLEVADVIEADAKALNKRQKGMTFDVHPAAKEAEARIRRVRMDDNEGRWQAAVEVAGDVLAGTGIDAADLALLNKHYRSKVDHGGLRLELVAIAGQLARGDLAGFVDRLYRNSGAGNDPFELTARMLADMLGAATRNKIGFGHENAYYKARDMLKGPKSATINEAQATEVMANYFALEGGSLPHERAAARIARALLPNVFKALDAMMQELGK